VLHITTNQEEHFLYIVTKSNTKPLSTQCT